MFDNELMSGNLIGLWQTWKIDRSNYLKAIIATEVTRSIMNRISIGGFKTTNYTGIAGISGRLG